MESVNENLVRDLVCFKKSSEILENISEILEEMLPGKISFLHWSIQGYYLEKSISARVAVSKKKWLLWQHVQGIK